MTRSNIWRLLRDIGPVPSVFVVIATLAALCAPLYAPSGTLWVKRQTAITQHYSAERGGTRTVTTERSNEASVNPVGNLQALAALQVLGLGFVAWLVARANRATIWHVLATYGNGLAAVCTLLLAVLTSRLSAQAKVDELSALVLVLAVTLVVWLVAMAFAGMAFLLTRSSRES